LIPRLFVAWLCAARLLAARLLPPGLRSRLDALRLVAASVVPSRLYHTWFDPPLIITADRRLNAWLLQPGRIIGPVAALRPISVVQIIPTIRAVLTAAGLVIASTTDAALVRVTAAEVAAPAVAVVATAYDGRRNDPGAAEVASGDAPARVVVDRALALASDELLAARPAVAPVLKDEAWLGAIGPHEDDAIAAIVAIWVVPGIVVHVHPETHARRVVRVPGRVADVRVAVIAQEPRIVIMPLDIIRHDVIIPIDIAFWLNALRQIGHRDVGIAADTAVRDYAVVPVLVGRYVIVPEGISGRDGKQIADARIIIDRKGFAAQLVAVDLELPAAAGEVVIPRFTRKQNADATIGVHTEDGDVGVLIELEVHPDALAAGIDDVIAPVRGQLDTGSVNSGVPVGWSRYQSKTE